MINTNQSVRFLKYRQNPWISLGIILFAPSMIIIDIFIVNVALPTIQNYYHSTAAYVQLIVAAYLIGYTIFLITGSRAGDRYGRKRIFCVGIIAFTIASAGCGWAHTIQQLIIFRFLQGVSAAFTGPQSYTLIHLYFQDGKKRDKAYGIFGICSGLAAIIGQLLGGYFISSHLITDSWRLIFLINIPLGIIATVAAAFLLNESKEEQMRKFDYSGIALLTVGLSTLVVPITRGRELGFPLWSIIMLAFSIILLIVFIMDQRNKTHLNRSPLINMELFSVKNFNLGLLSVLFFFGVHNGFLLNCALLLQNGYHFSAKVSSYFFSVFGLGFMLAAYWSIKNASRYGVRMLQYGCLLMGASFIGQTIYFNINQPSYIVLALLLAIYGVGNGLVLPSLMNVSLKGVHSRFAGTAGGVYSTVQQLGSALGVSIIGGIFLSCLQSRAISFSTAYAFSLIFMTIYLVIIVLLLQRLRKLSLQQP